MQRILKLMYAIIFYPNPLRGPTVLLLCFIFDYIGREVKCIFVQNIKYFFQRII